MSHLVGYGEFPWDKRAIFNLPLLVLKARHLSGSAFCTGFSRLEVPEQALGGILLGLELVVKINLLNIHIYHTAAEQWKCN